MVLGMVPLSWLLATYLRLWVGTANGFGVGGKGSDTSRASRFRFAATNHHARCAVSEDIRPARRVG